MTDITQNSNEANDTYTWLDQRFSGNFIGAGALLGIFTYICRQRPTIHWWRWWSRAPEAWHHWCGRSQNSTGSNWIPIECSSEKNIFDGTPENFLSKELICKIFSTACVSTGALTHARWWKAIVSFIWPITFTQSNSTLANCHWKLSLCLGLSATAGEANCPHYKLQ